VPRRYVPNRGDVVWLQFNPQAGHEQAGHRPAVVVSPKDYNAKVPGSAGVWPALWHFGAPNPAISPSSIAVSMPPGRVQGPGLRYCIIPHV
jgi:hypothetical protein